MWNGKDYEEAITFAEVSVILKGYYRQYKIENNVMSPLGTQRCCFGTCEENGYCISHFRHTIAVSIQTSFRIANGISGFIRLL